MAPSKNLVSRLDEHETISIHYDTIAKLSGTDGYREAPSLCLIGLFMSIICAKPKSIAYFHNCLFYPEIIKQTEFLSNISLVLVQFNTHFFKTKINYSEFYFYSNLYCVLPFLSDSASFDNIKHEIERNYKDLQFLTDEQLGAIAEATEQLNGPAPLTTFGSKAPQENIWQDLNSTGHNNSVGVIFDNNYDRNGWCLAMALGLAIQQLDCAAMALFYSMLKQIKPRPCQLKIDSTIDRLKKNFRGGETPLPQKELARLLCVYLPYLDPTFGSVELHATNLKRIYTDKLYAGGEHEMNESEWVDRARCIIEYDK